ncbi:MAG: S8 family serine peptidase [Anaerolineales bacterium]|jgi:subtilisin family serine protease
MRRRILKITITSLLALVILVPGTGLAQTSRPAAPAAAPFVPGQIIVGLDASVSIQRVAAALSARSVRPLGGGRAFLLEVAGDAARRASEAAGIRGVSYAEPNWLRQLHDAPNDGDYPSKWDLHNDGSLCDGGDCATAGADMDWQEAYTYLGSSFSGSAVVAVIDTGIDAAHPDLDDKIVAGYDYLDGDNNPSDTYGHGTHVSGIALAETNNLQGTSGVAYSPNIKVMPLRVCDSGGCPTSAIVSAIYRAADNGANVINLSLGGRFGSASEQQAINYAWENGLVIAASSGNDGSGKVSYPAAFVNAIAVGSTNWHDQLAPYSNSGNDLDVVAPGGDMSRYHDPGGIYSTMPTYNVYLTTSYSYSKDYDQLQGTSMAAPQVSGLAALLFARGVSDNDGDGYTNDEIREIIESTADDLGKSGWDRDFGWGRVNVNNAVLAADGGGGGGENMPPTADFTYSTSGLTADFTDASTDSDGNLVAWSWDFGDGNTSTDQSPSHTYAADGTYAVNLTVTDDGGTSDTITKNVTVSSTSGALTLYVFSVNMSPKTAGPNRSAIAVVTIKDTDGSLIEGATVSGTWSGDYNGSTSGTTAADGTVSFESGKLRQPNVTFTFTVNDVVKSGYSYDSTQGETTDTITVQ